jgi:hypothetical protein
MILTTLGIVVSFPDGHLANNLFFLVQGHDKYTSVACQVERRVSGLEREHLRQHVDIQPERNLESGHNRDQQPEHIQVRHRRRNRELYGGHTVWQ